MSRNRRQTPFFDGDSSFHHFADMLPLKFGKVLLHSEPPNKPLRTVVDVLIL